VTGRRVGIYGGTFDPIHIGHLATAVSARHELALNRLLFVVANDPWQKTTAGEEVSAADVRFAMVSMAVSGVEGVEASDLELRRPGPSYMADTLNEIRAEEPDAELFLIVGSDVAAGLPTWERADDVRRLATIAVMTRPDHPGAIPPNGWRCVGVDVPQIDVSSTDIRARVAAGKPIDFLVPDGVLRIIEEHRLYGSRR
jgi:nicotinate-nucleotide adenylyltransferase